jgi:4-hydroxy-tetrahydrodipicolinate synthase
MKLGASGAITGLANIAPDLMLPLIDGIEEPRVNAMVELVLPYAVTAAVKALVGLRRNDPIAWGRMRAPLASLGESDVRKLGAAIDAIRSRRAA